MADKTIAIPRLDDPTALQLFEEMVKAKPPQRFSIEVLGVGSFKKEEEGKGPIVEELRRAGSFLISQIDLRYEHFNIFYVRGGDPSHPSLNTDHIRISYESAESSISHVDRVRVLRTLDHLRLSGGAFSSDSPPIVNDLEAIYKSTILKLDASFAAQIEKITSWTVVQAGEAERRRAELAEETQRERDLLRKEYEEKHQSLVTKEGELEQRKHDLDDRDYMHARRATRADMQKLIAAREQKFALTPGTRKLRLPVHVLMSVLIICLAALNVWYLWTFGGLDLSSAHWTVIAASLLKQGILAAFLIGAILYYARWMNRWFEEHSTAEFLLKQFQLDFDRASWIVETALEWRRQEKSELPPALLEGVTRNLFSMGGTGPRSNAADDLASALVGNASGLKVKVGENELNFDRKGIERLAKDS